MSIIEECSIVRSNSYRTNQLAIDSQQEKPNSKNSNNSSDNQEKNDQKIVVSTSSVPSSGAAEANTSAVDYCQSTISNNETTEMQSTGAIKNVMYAEQQKKFDTLLVHLTEIIDVLKSK